MGDHRADRAFAERRAHRGAERNELLQSCRAFGTGEEVLFERRLRAGLELAEPVVDEFFERGAHARSMHARSLPSARWRITRMFPSDSPVGGSSSKKLAMTTARSRSDSASRQAARRSRSNARGSASSTASSTSPYISRS